MTKYINSIICNYIQDKVNLTILKIETIHLNHLPTTFIGVATEIQDRLSTSTFNMALVV